MNRAGQTRTKLSGRLDRHEVHLGKLVSITGSIVKRLDQRDVDMADTRRRLEALEQEVA